MTSNSSSCSQKHLMSTSWRQKYVMTSQLWRKYVMTSKVCHDVSKFRHGVKNTSWRQNVRHVVKKFIMTSKYVMTSRRSSWRHKYVEGTSWRQKHRREVTKYAVTSKVCYYVKNCVMTSNTFSQLRFLFAFVLRIFWHQFDISTMCRSRVWPLAYSHDMSRQCRYHTRLPPY